jgi:hypothetical protein
MQHITSAACIAQGNLGLDLAALGRSYKRDIFKEN